MPTPSRAAAGRTSSTGGGGRDSIDGGIGSDLVEIDLGEGGDTVDGGDGFDGLQIDASTSNVAAVLDLTLGTVQLYDGTFTNQFSNFEKFDVATGSGNDSVRGGDADPLPIVRTFGEFPNQTFFVQKITGDVIETGAGKDSIDGGKGADRISAGVGDDRVWLSSGADVLDGGDDVVPEGSAKIDRDTLVVDLSRFSGAELEALQDFVMPEPTGESEISHLDATGADITDFEKLEYIGLSGKVSVTGGAYEDAISGGAQGDSLGGGGGTDTLVGGQGDDTVSGGSGDDIITAGAAGDADQIDGGSGIDTLLVDRSSSNAAQNVDFRPSFDIVSVGSAAVTGVEAIDYRGGFNSDTVRVDYGPHKLSGGISAGFDRAYVDLTNVDHDVTAQWVPTSGFPGYKLVFDNGLTIERFIQYNVIVGDHAFTITNSPPNGASPQVNVTNAAGFHVVSGTPGPDTLTGGINSDQVSGWGGGDSLDGDDGDDLVFGGTGDDTLVGGAGADTLQGEGGEDSALGGGDDDLVSGGSGRDTLRGDAGLDTVQGGKGDDLIIDEAPGGASLHGGGGHDVLVLDRSADSLDLTASVYGADGAVSDGTVFKSIEELHLTTGSGADSVAFSQPIDGDQTIDTGDGVDLVVLNFSGSQTGVDFHATGGGASEVVAGGATVVTLSHVEGVKVTGGSAGDTLAGGSAHDQTILSGAEGDDKLSSAGTGPGGDSLSGGGGDDTIAHSGTQSVRIDAGTGADVVTVNRSAAGSDLVLEVVGKTSTLSDSSSIKNAETQTVVTGSGADRASFTDLAATTQTFDGGGGVNTALVNLSNATTSVTHVQTGAGASLTTASGVSVTLANVQSVNVIGGSGDDSLVAGTGADRLNGSLGHDNLVGGAGDNQLRGGDGTDTIAGHAGKDVLYGGAGADLFVFGTGDGRDKIKDFAGADGDRLQLASGTDYTLTEMAGHTILSLEPGTSIVVLNIDAVTLDGLLVFN